jgi:NTP pyrophosphatase (non-canonical NTP hydrolase)
MSKKDKDYVIGKVEFGPKEGGLGNPKDTQGIKYQFKAKAFEDVQTFDMYQRLAFLTALPTTKNANYMALGLVNEAGEVAGVRKKFLRGDSELETYGENIAKEIGDVLWYCAGLATVLNLSLADIARDNIFKLQDRQNRGKIQGSGDNR